MKLIIEMPTVDTCDATACAYNVDRACHARAITVGDGLHPACDTYVAAANSAHVAVQSAPAGVGACKVDACRFNRDLECNARAIDVHVHAQHADCSTFKHR